ncbi:hypothetical protein CYMTET_12123 [Cymbomonas tetramitiformis]|uniref:Uncharacterized protein n=1 Tax=Cymbomonas tetramitiformis TaxID=36881 RepID=A0AAE0GKQ0_9CHLO|nr:hypothetical protein CYMTET_12123 [Cymbomonas tetramitiformis]
MLLSKACPELVPEDSIQANGAKAAWEFLKTRAVGANKELLPATMQADTLFDVSWSPDSAIIEFHEMTIAYKEFFQVMKREIPKDPMFFNTSQADLYKNLLQVLRAFVAKEVPMPGNEYLKNMHSSSQENLRPVQKPIRLYRELMRLYSDVDAVVMEFPCGTAPASIAGYMEQRHVLCMDMDKVVLAAAKERFEEMKAKDIEIKKTISEKQQLPPGAMPPWTEPSDVQMLAEKVVVPEAVPEVTTELTDAEMLAIGFSIEEIHKLEDVTLE